MNLALLFCLLYAFSVLCMANSDCPCCGTFLSCCPAPYVPRRTYYITFTWQSGGCNCPSAASVTFPIELTGTTDLEPLTGVVGEFWYEWRGQTNVNNCGADGMGPETPGTIRFQVILTCDTAGIGADCLGYDLFAIIGTYYPPSTEPSPDSSGGFPQSDCDCTPAFSLPFGPNGGGDDIGRDCVDDTGKSIKGIFTAEITE